MVDNADNGDPVRILVVDDEVNILRLISDVLGKYGGYTVDSVSDGEEALLLLGKKNISAIFC